MITIGIVGALVTWSLAPYLLGPFIFVMLGVAVAITIVQNKQARPRCPHCNYDLRGLPKNTMKCPECGRLLTGA
jgi:tRNA(Ile2) C34 agmatinyltransferase TiaS